jgi:hypothetical protein
MLINNEMKQANLAIEHKRVGYTEDVLRAYDKNPEKFTEEVTSRDIFKAIELDKFYSLSPLLSIETAPKTGFSK